MRSTSGEHDLRDPGSHPSDGWATPPPPPPPRGAADLARGGVRYPAQPAAASVGGLDRSGGRSEFDGRRGGGGGYRSTGAGERRGDRVESGAPKEEELGEDGGGGREVGRGEGGGGAVHRAGRMGGSEQAAIAGGRGETNHRYFASISRYFAEIGNEFQSDITHILGY
jgi:hypothetical protein